MCIRDRYGTARRRRIRIHDPIIEAYLCAQPTEREFQHPALRYVHHHPRTVQFIVQQAPFIVGTPRTGWSISVVKKRITVRAHWRYLIHGTDAVRVYWEIDVGANIHSLRTIACSDGTRTCAIRSRHTDGERGLPNAACTCLLYTSDAADERSSVDLGGRRIIKKKKEQSTRGAVCLR